MKRNGSRGVSPRWLSVCAIITIAPMLAMNSRSPATPRQSASRTVWDSVYSTSQATRGESTYVKTCARCHGASLTGGDESPPLTGGAFLGNWNGLPLSDLQTRIKTTMPTDSVGVYDKELVTDVMAFLLKANGFPAGQAALPSDVNALKEITLQSTRP
jgi:S-disulfanyl-L-cysteine oxidoreductase SoxD